MEYGWSGEEEFNNSDAPKINQINQQQYQNIEEQSSPYSSQSTGPVLYFETLPVSKLVLLSIATLGIYDLMWGYRYWRAVKEQTGLNCSPFWRCIFLGISNFWLFDMISKNCAKYNDYRSTSFPAALYAALYLILNGFSKYDNALWLISLFAPIIILAIVQHNVNMFNERIPNRVVNNWTVANVLWVIFGSLFIMLCIIGTFIPEDIS